VSVASTVPASIDLAALRERFPALRQQVHGRPLVYLDNAATTQRPDVVIRATVDFYEKDNANVHRGVHTLSQRATRDFEEARQTVRAFVDAAHDAEILFTKGCTEAINLVAATWGRTMLREGDEILLSTMEHHANIVPWQLVAEMTGATIRPIPIDDRGQIDLSAYGSMLTERVKLVGIVHVSNSIGTINPVAEITAMAHRVGARVMIDGAQALAHQKVSVRDLDVDFYAMSGHKVYGPTGIGALYGKRDLLEAMPPYQAGGDMIRTVTFEKTTFNDLPNRFEPGTPNIAGAIGWAAALNFVDRMGIDAIGRHEQTLTRYAQHRLSEIDGLRLVGTADDKAGIVAFSLEGIHPHDIGTVLDRNGVAIRAGHHCTMPLMQRFGLPATVRASFAMYTSEAEIDALVAAVQQAKEILG